ncbi:MAG: hypothetical protein AAF411_14955 [Myxococcota bacterium]
MELAAYPQAGGCVGSELASRPFPPPVEARVVFRAPPPVGSRGVLGVFWYESDDREFDFEWSSWDRGAPYAQFVNAARRPREIRRVLLANDEAFTVTLRWSRARVSGSIRSASNHFEWSSPAPPPRTGNIRLHLNAWCTRGATPTNGFQAFVDAVQIRRL